MNGSVTAGLSTLTAGQESSPDAVTGVSTQAWRAPGHTYTPPPSNTTMGGQHPASPPLLAFDVVHFKVIFILLYSAVFLLCIVGNILVIIVILKHRKMRTITNFFLANLAVADLCVGTFCILPNLTLFLSPTWLIGKLMCKLYYFIQCVSYTSSIVILTVISLERYFAIIYPILSKRLSRMCLMRLVAVVIWVMSVIYGLPLLVLYDQVTVPRFNGSNETVSFCVKPAPIDMKAYTMANFWLWYALPLLTMTCMYSRISLFLWRSGQMYDGKMNGNCCHFVSERGRVVKADGPGRAGRGGGARQGAVVASKHRAGPEINVSEVNTAICGDVTVHHPLKAPAVRVCMPLEPDALAVAPRPACGTGGAEEGGGQCMEEGGGQEGGGQCVVAGGVALGEAAQQDSPRWARHTEDGARTLLPPPAISRITSNRLSDGPLSTTHTSNLSTTSSLSMTYLGPTLATAKPRTEPRKVVRKYTNPLVSRRKVIRLLIVIISSFAVCVLPHHARLLWQHWSSRPRYSFGQTFVPPVTFLLFYLNSCLNPILYAFLSDNFRKAFRELNSFRNPFRRHSSTCSQSSKGLN